MTPHQAHRTTILLWIIAIVITIVLIGYWEG